MEIPFVVNDIRFCNGLKGYESVSSMPRQSTGTEELSAFIDIFECKMVTLEEVVS